LGQSVHEKWPVSKWIKFLFNLYFAEAALLFFLSFLIFIVQRRYDMDPMMISGAFTGTTQLTYFIAVNTATIMLALAGYYLYRYYTSIKEWSEKHDDWNDNLRLYFKTLSVTSVPLFCLMAAGIIYFVLS
jgi:hypothetical protein